MPLPKQFNWVNLIGFFFLFRGGEPAARDGRGGRPYAGIAGFEFAGPALPAERAVPLLGGDRLQVTAQELISFTFEIHEHDAVAELGMAGDDASLDDDGVAAEPEGDLQACAEWEGHDQLDVAAAATEVGGLEAHGEVAAFLADFDLDLDGVARMLAEIWFGGNRVGGLGVGRIHGLAPGLGGVSCWQGPWVDHRR